MPGFSINNTSSQNSKYNKAEIRRKHRWRVATGAGFTDNPRDWLYLQKAQRPQFKFQEAVMHHDQEQAYFAGKQEWEPISMTFYDVEGGDGSVNDISTQLYNWIGGRSNSRSVGVIADAEVRIPESYKLDLVLQMTAADGSATETWTLYGAWPREVNWQDLSYEDTNLQLIDVTVRYDRAEKR